MSTQDLLREARDPSTPAARLSEIAQADRATWTALAAHPAAYPGLLDWLGEHGDDAVREAIASRGAVAPPPPPPPPAATAAPVVDPGTEETVTLPSTDTPSSDTPSSDTSSTETPAPEATPEGTASRSTGRILAVLAVVAVLLVGGFFGAQALTGDDDDPVATSTDSTGDASPAPTDSSDDAGAGDPEEFCTTMKGLQDISSETLAGAGGTPDPDVLRKAVEKQAKIYQTIGENPPAEIKQEAGIVSEFMTKLSDPDVYTQSESPFAGGKEDEYVKAAQAITSYYAKTCL